MNNGDLFNRGNIFNAFNGARVYLSGGFSVSKSEIANRLTDMGASVFSIGVRGGESLLGLAKTTCVIIQGDKPSEADIIKIKTLRNDGFHIPIITEKEMMEIIAGEKYKEFPLPVKNVDITYDFIFSKDFPKIKHLNFFEYTHPLGRKELFLHDIKGDRGALEQSLGNIGAYCSREFDPKAIDYCWLKKETIDKLKNGEKDDFVCLIADLYNKSDYDKFTYQFIIESEVVFWLEYRAKERGDKLSLDSLTKYQQSIYNL